MGQAAASPYVNFEDYAESEASGGKFRACKHRASLREYVLVSQDVRQVEVFRRNEEWRGEVATGGMRVMLHGASVEVDAIYGAFQA